MEAVLRASRTVLNTMMPATARHAKATSLWFWEIAGTIYCWDAKQKPLIILAKNVSPLSNWMDPSAGLTTARPLTTLGARVVNVLFT